MKLILLPVVLSFVLCAGCSRHHDSSSGDAESTENAGAAGTAANASPPLKSVIAGSDNESIVGDNKFQLAVIISEPIAFEEATLECQGSKVSLKNSMLSNSPSSDKIVVSTPVINILTFIGSSCGLVFWQNSLAITTPYFFTLPPMISVVNFDRGSGTTILSGVFGDPSSALLKVSYECFDNLRRKLLKGESQLDSGFPQASERLVLRGPPVKSGLLCEYRAQVDGISGNVETLTYPASQVQGVVTSAEIVGNKIGRQQIKLAGNFASSGNSVSLSCRADSKVLAASILDENQSSILAEVETRGLPSDLVCGSIRVDSSSVAGTDFEFRDRLTPARTKNKVVGECSSEDPLVSSTIMIGNDWDLSYEFKDTRKTGCMSSIDRAKEVGNTKLNFVVSKDYDKADLEPAPTGKGVMIDGFCWRKTDGACAASSTFSTRNFMMNLSSCFQYAVDQGMSISILLHIDELRGRIWRNSLAFDPLEKNAHSKMLDTKIVPKDFIKEQPQSLIARKSDRLPTLKEPYKFFVGQYVLGKYKVDPPKAPNAPKPPTLEKDVPDSNYYEALVLPVVNALRAVDLSRTNVEFSMQGEMGATIAAYPESYIEIRKRIKDLLPDAQSLKVGISLNYNKTFGDYSKLAAENVNKIADLFSQSDFIGLSAYNIMKRYPVDPNEFENNISSLRANLYQTFGKDIVPHKKELQFSEVGIGGGGKANNGRAVAEDPQTMLYGPYSGIWTSENPWTRTDLSETRKEYYRALLSYLKSARCREKDPISAAYLWNLDSWDPQGLTRRTKRFQDDDVVKVIRDANEVAAATVSENTSSGD